MNLPKSLVFTKSHEWVKFLSEDTALIGLSDYAQDQMGSLVFVNLPMVGDELTAGESLGDVESVKAVSDIYSPVSGTVSRINEELFDAPEAINQDPYAAWLVEVSDISEQEDFLTAAEYEEYCLKEE